MKDHGGEDAEAHWPGLASDAADTRRTHPELAVAAAGVGTFDWDLFTGTLIWDERLIELFGYDPSAVDQTIEAFRARLHPDDASGVSAQLQQTIDAWGSYQDEFRVMLPEGGQR
ncbi:PAS domain-containing protein [Blastococcus colisei]|uniref:PAS domain-containing protein n=1 Tax=Blastococcus colisei TaxID=1564162 RepID=UPI0014774DCE|nr:PAS domain-containing protein [Blastococcus colisei]